MKNPNGYGSVYKLSGKRRKPFGVRITKGWELNKETGKAKQLYKNIGYYKTRPEAMIALAEYNKDPYDIDAKKIRFEELFELFIADKFPDEILSETDRLNRNAYKMAFKHAESLHDLLFISIRKTHMQEAINQCEKGHSTKSKIKVLFGQMYQFALQNDWCEKDYSKFVVVPANKVESSREPFSDKEIKMLWENLVEFDFIDTVLIMIYTGLRPGELILIENKNINLEERYMRGGIKTKAGTNRVIPINKKILPLIKERMDPEKKFLILNSKRNKMSYSTYLKDRWTPLMDDLGITHRPHDCRHTFATLMDNSGANKLSIKKIIGHASQDITDKVYTHKDIIELVKAVDLI